VEKESCLCIAEGELVPVTTAGMVAVAAPSHVRVDVALSPECAERYSGRVLGLRAQSAVDVTHYLNAGAVCFARAVNDTPKIAALLFGAAALGTSLATPMLTVVALAMAAGGWFHSRKVAETMSKNITNLNTGQGLTANLMTTLPLGLTLGWVFYSLLA